MKYNLSEISDDKLQEFIDSFETDEDNGNEFQ